MASGHPFWDSVARVKDQELFDILERWATEHGPIESCDPVEYRCAAHLAVSIARSLPRDVAIAMFSGMLSGLIEERIAAARSN